MSIENKTININYLTGFKQLDKEYFLSRAITLLAIKVQRSPTKVFRKPREKTILDYQATFLRSSLLCNLLFCMNIIADHEQKCREKTSS